MEDELMKRRIIFVVLLIMISVAVSACSGGSKTVPKEMPLPETYTHEAYEYQLFADGSAVITKYSGTDEKLTVPSELDGHMLKGIGDYAFMDRRSLTSITLPDSITYLGANPWMSCKNLTTINVSPKHPSLEVIDGALYSKADKRLIWYPMTSKADTFEVPDGIRIIGDSAFFNCNNLTSITLPGSVKSIGDNAFYNCDSLTLINLPDSITSIGNGAFSSCRSLTSIMLPDSITDLGANPWSTCENLAMINVSPKHSSLAVIDGVLYSKADKRLVWYPMTSEADTYEVPDGIRIIGGQAFYSCNSLISITLPDSITAIGDFAFGSCHSLTSIALPDSITNIGNYAFCFCHSLTSITLPDSVTTIGYGAFIDCESLTFIVPEGSYAEQYCVDNKLTYQYTDSLDWLND